MKKCSCCQEQKKEEDYNRNISRTDGLSPYCKACAKVYKAKFYAENTQQIKDGVERWRNANREKVRKITNKSSAKHKEARRANSRDWYEKNKEHKSRKTIEYRKTDAYKNNVQFKLRDVLRARLHTALRGKKKLVSSVKNLGCTIEELKIHLEQKFKPGMTWDNWSFEGWHIDHIKPFSKFDLTDEEQQKLAVHYTNLQPLWAKDNLQKHNKN